MSIKTEIREHPILFSGPMVWAILSGAKTQTRRVITRRNCDSVPGCLWKRLEFDNSKVPDGAPPLLVDGSFGAGQYLHVPCRPHPDDPQTADCWTRERVYSRWSVRDRLWVRETWATFRKYDDLPPRALTPPTPVEYQCDKATRCWPTKQTSPIGIIRPSIFMPRWASRILSEVQAIRAERVADISDTDCLAEGIEPHYATQGFRVPLNPPQFAMSPRDDYRALWDSLNAKRSGMSWSSNPWVWVITFKRIQEADRGQGD